MGSWQKKKLVQNLHKLLTTEKPINIIQDKNYQSDFDRLMAETAETKYPNWSHLPTTQSLWLRGFLYVSTFSAVLGGKNIFHYDNKKLKKDILSSILRTEPPRCKSEGVSFALFNSRDCLHPLQIFLDPSLFRHDNLFPNLLRIGPLQPCPGTLTPAHQENIRRQLHLLLTFACGLIE